MTPSPGPIGRTAVERRLFRLLWLSVAAAVATITLKTVAWLLTGSVGLLSDAAESLVNLVAAVVALGALSWASKPADEEHAYGHTKAEYFSAGVEGMLIFVAAISIAAAAIERLLHQQPIGSIGPALAVSAVASMINFVVGLLLLRTGRKHRAIVLEADGRHLMTDVWTSVGVIGAVAAVGLTGWQWLDPAIALVVAVNIVYAGTGLVRRSVGGLMDRALDPSEQTLIRRTLEEFEARGVTFHALRTRQAGQRSFVSLHVLVPGAWTVQRGHDVVEEVEQALHRTLANTTVFTHLEPVEDPRSYEDIGLDRVQAPPGGDGPG